MKHYLIFTAICLISILSVSCAAPVEEKPTPTSISDMITPPVDEPYKVTYPVSQETTVVTDDSILSVDIDNFPGVSEGYGLYGATVMVTNVYPGWSGSAPITIVNGKDQARVFHLGLQQPGTSLTDGYEKFPEEYFAWFTIEDLEPRVAIGGVCKVSITMSVPFNFPAEMMGKKYDMRIIVEDWSQSGFIQLARQEKWLITFWDGKES